MPETWQIAIFQKMQKIPRSQNFWGGYIVQLQTKVFPIKLGSKTRASYTQQYNMNIEYFMQTFREIKKKTTFFIKLKAILERNGETTSIIRGPGLLGFVYFRSRIVPYSFSIGFATPQSLDTIIGRHMRGKAEGGCSNVYIIY